MSTTTNVEKCKTCGCNSCSHEHGLHLHREIESLKQQLLARDSHIHAMETAVLSEARKFPSGQAAALRDEINCWQEKYDRLYEAHKKLQKVNQGLEDKLLKIVDKFETEKGSLTRDMSSLTQRLVEARVLINRITDENERYRTDLNVAVQLLQCKPSNFVSHKLDSLPSDLQQKVKVHMNHHRRDSVNNTKKPEMKTIKVPIPTFPPTAMVYSVNKVGQEKEETKNQKNIDIVSAAIMAKVLEEREKERRQKHCSTCRCLSSENGNLTVQVQDRAVQTFPDVISASFQQGRVEQWVEQQHQHPAVPVTSSAGTGLVRQETVMYTSDYRNPRQSNNILLDNAYQNGGSCLMNGPRQNVVLTPSANMNGSTPQVRGSEMRRSATRGTQPNVHTTRTRSESDSSGDSTSRNPRWSRGSSSTSTETQI